MVFFVLRFLLVSERCVRQGALCVSGADVCVCVEALFWFTPQRYDFFLIHANKMRIFCKNDRFYLSYSLLSYQIPGIKRQRTRCW